MRVDDAFRVLRRTRRVEDQRRLAGGRVLGRRARDVALELRRRLVDVDDRDRSLDLVLHLLDLGLAGAVGDDQPGPRVPDAERQVAGAEHVGAGHGDEPALERAEHRPVPGGDLPEDDEDAVAAVETRSEEVRPARCVLGDLVERAPVDDPLAVDVGQRLAKRVARELLDHVAREVEPCRDLPAGRIRPGVRGLESAFPAECHAQPSTACVSQRDR